MDAGMPCQTRPFSTRAPTYAHSPRFLFLAAAERSRFVLYDLLYYSRFPSELKFEIVYAPQLPRLTYKLTSFMLYILSGLKNEDV